MTEENDLYKNFQKTYFNEALQISYNSYKPLIDFGYSIENELCKYNINQRSDWASLFRVNALNKKLDNSVDQMPDDTFKSHFLTLLLEKFYFCLKIENGESVDDFNKKTNFEKIGLIKTLFRDKDNEANGIITANTHINIPIGRPFTLEEKQENAVEAFDKMLTNLEKQKFNEGIYCYPDITKFVAIQLKKLQSVHANKEIIEHVIGVCYKTFHRYIQENIYGLLEISEYLIKYSLEERSNYSNTNHSTPDYDDYKRIFYKFAVYNLLKETFQWRDENNKIIQFNEFFFINTLKQFHTYGANVPCDVTDPDKQEYNKQVTNERNSYFVNHLTKNQKSIYNNLADELNIDFALLNDRILTLVMTPPIFINAMIKNDLFQMTALKYLQNKKIPNIVLDNDDIKKKVAINMLLDDCVLIKK